MRKYSWLATLILALALPTIASAGFRAESDGGAAPAGGVDTDYAIVQLKGDPLSTYSKTKPPPGKKIDFDSNTVKSYRAQLSAERNDFKQWLASVAPAANVTGQYDIALNAVSVQLNGTSLDTLRSSPLVTQADYEPTFTYQATDPDLSLISAIDAWNAVSPGGPANAGKGVKVAVIDTGIDISNPCFSDAGFPNTPQLGDRRFTNNKVIVAKVFNMQTPRFGYTPQALQEHGTHVAGTVACDYNTFATVNGVPTFGISGVAPAAQLGNYNVFPGNVLSVRWEDLLNALEAAYKDGMDVANMSIGGTQPGIQSLVEIAINNLDQAGMVSAVANGNAGPNLFTAEAPGSAARALTAGAITVPHFIGVDISGIPASTGQFPTFTTTTTAPLAPVASSATAPLSLACSAISQNLTGKVALVSRGSCTFGTKDRNAAAAGAIAVIIVNNVNGDPIAMAGDGGASPIPAYMVSLANGPTIRALSSVTISGKQQYFTNTGGGSVLAGFSSRGPTDTSFLVKPDVVAPGVNVLSSVPAFACGAPPCFAFFQGTSMATPHLAGSAAVVIGQHPTWSAAQVRSAIVNTADQGVVKPTRGSGFTNNPLEVGAGRDNLNSAVRAQVALDPVSVSFGAVPSGSGQTRTATIALSQLGSTPAASVTVGPANTSGVTFAASLSGSLITVTATAAQGASVGPHYAVLFVKDAQGNTLAHAELFTWVK